MVKLKCTDQIFLVKLANQIEAGENIERSLFLIDEIPPELHMKLYLGEDITEILMAIEFNYPNILNLLSSTRNAEVEENVKRMRTTAELIRKREEILQEKENAINIQKRRLKIIRYVTLITIAIIAGFSPLFTNIYSLIENGVFQNTFTFFSVLSISFLLVNILNNYFLLKMVNERNIKIKLGIVAILHIGIAIIVNIFLSNYVLR
ncbi:MAG: hypothetical protein KAS95_02980 [Candidatus Heimdallarchaeota archaeon]|nr:hypothetical protein [Candidatus Heimdallarchaeota archaeon]